MIVALFDSDGTLYTGQFGRGMMKYSDEHGRKYFSRRYYASNEIGTINRIREIAEVCRANNILFHTDAVQAAAYLPVDVNELGVDLLSLGAHKFYGPKGVGALYIRKGTPLVAHLTGGGQEFSLRAGTQNVPYIVGFAEALRLTQEEREQRVAHVKPLRDKIIGTVLETIPDSQLTGDLESRLPHHSSFHKS